MIRNVLVVAALAAFITGCGTTPSTNSRIFNTAPASPEGAPDPQGPGFPWNAPETSQSTPPQTRPREIRLNGVNPCSLISHEDWGKFGIDTDGRQATDAGFKTPRCAYIGTPAAFSVTIVPIEGIEGWRTGKHGGERAEVDPIDGFPALSAKISSMPDDCLTAVDVASGQHLLTSVHLNETGSSRTPCSFAHQVAESAMNTLIRR